MQTNSTNTSHVKSGSAQIIPIDRESRLPVEKTEYITAIHEWIHTRDAAEALSREEIGRLTRDVRIDAQRKSIIINLAEYYRRHTKADPAPGVLVVMTLLSDNEKGSCSLSQITLGKLFDRDPSAIRAAQRRLKDDGLIVIGRGRYSSSYPVIPKAVTHGYNHMTWLVEAICDDEPSNVLESLADCQSAREPSGLNQCAREPSGLNDVNPLDNEIQSAREPSAYFTKINSTTLDTRERGCNLRKAAAAVATAIGAASAAFPAAAAPMEPPAIVQNVPAKIGYDELLRHLENAAGNAMSNPAASPGIIVLSDPYRWLEQGCDLMLDVLPVIRARSAKAPRGSIRSWSYFTEAVVDARNKRLTPLPDVPKPSSAQSSRSDEASLNGFVPPAWEKDLKEW